MRPRTELEKRVIGLSSALPALNPSQESYPKALFKKEGLTLKKRVFCKCCGGEFPDNGSKRKASESKSEPCNVRTDRHTHIRRDYIIRGFHGGKMFLRLPHLASWQPYEIRTERVVADMD